MTYLDGKDVVNDVMGVNFNIVIHSHRQLQLCIVLAALTMLYIIVHALNILNMHSSTTNSLNEYLPNKDRRRDNY